MAAVYSAIATGEMPVITGFGNSTQAGDDATAKEYPVLLGYIAKGELMNSSEFILFHNNAWKSYNAFLAK